MSRKSKKLLLASAVFSAGMLAASCGGGGGGGGGGAQAPSPSPTPSPTPTPTVDHVAVVQGTDFKVYRVEFRSMGGTMESEVDPNPIGSATANILPIWQFSNRKILACIDALDNITLQKVPNGDGQCDPNAGLYLVDGDSVDKLTDGPVWVTIAGGTRQQVSSRHYNVIQTPAGSFAVFKEDGTVYTRNAQTQLFNQQTGGLVYTIAVTNEVYAVDPNGNMNKVGISSDLVGVRRATIAHKYLLVKDTTNNKYYVIDTELGSCVGGSCTPIYQVGADIANAVGAVVGNNLYVAMVDNTVNNNVHYAIINLSTGGVSVSTTNVDADKVAGPDKAVGGLIAADGEGNVYYVSDDGNAANDDALVVLVNDGTNTDFVATSNDPNCYNNTPTNINGGNINLIPFAHNVLLIDNTPGNNKACQLYVDDAALGGPALTTVGRNTDSNRLNTYCFGASRVGDQTESVGCLRAGRGFASLKSSSLADLTISTYANAFGALYNIQGIPVNSWRVGKNIFARVGNSIYRCNPDDPGLCTLLQNITTGAGGNDYNTFLSVNFPIDGKVVGTGGNSGNTVVYFDFVNDERQQLAGLVGFPDLDVFNNKIVGTLGIQSPTSCQWNIAQVWEAGAVKPYTPVNTLDTAAGVCAQVFLGFVQ